MIEAVVLGSGTSNGVPTLGVEYPPEFLANPKNHRTRPSLLLRGPTGNVLVDCAPEMRLQLLREGVMDIDSVLITHTHADHIMGMDDLRSFCLKSKRDMPIYTSPAYQDDIRRVFAYAFAEFGPGIEVPRFDLRDVSDPLELGGMTIGTFWVEHGPWPVMALRVGDFAYVTDVNHIPADSWARLHGLETLVLDGVRRKPHPNHYHLDQAIAVAQALGAQQTYLTHLSHDYDHDVTNAELPEGIALAYDGLRIAIG
ncbi:MAG TPA: MBL fold metallo-hydrolase [Fimbriimonadaceae bacterium]|nr:MBL fold metallo-hydrolase [Fimbriimonadaceae bacterium]